MKKEHYLEILQGNLKQSAQKLNFWRRWTFQHENDPKHTSKLVAGWLQKNKVNVLGIISPKPGLESNREFMDRDEKQGAQKEADQFARTAPMLPSRMG